MSCVRGLEKRFREIIEVCYADWKFCGIEIISILEVKSLNKLEMFMEYFEVKNLSFWLFDV